MNSPKKFFHWLKKQTLSSPPKSVDQSILEFAKSSNAVDKPFYFSKYFILSSAIAASIVLLFTTSNLNKINQHPLSESPELLAYYDQIELMNQASQLTDKEWDMIIKEDRP